MSVPHVIAPRTIPELIRSAADHPTARLVAGGTLEIPSWQAAGAPDSILYLPSVASLSATGRAWCGAATTLAALAADPAMPTSLRAAATSVGGPALRSTATLGGNIVSASPGCLAVALLAMHGQVRLIQGDTVSGWQPIEAALSSRVPVVRVRWAQGLKTSFEKATLRAGIGPVLATVAVSAEDHTGDWLVACGGTGTRPHLLPRTAGLIADGCREPDEIGRVASDEVRVPSSAPDGEYRRHLVGTLVTRALNRLLTEGGQ
jgi:carbon-monoxide dehydrogenase medium subunit